MSMNKRGLRAFTDEQLKLFVENVHRSVRLAEKIAAKGQDFLATCTDPAQSAFVMAGMSENEATIARGKKVLSIAMAEQQRRGK